MGPLLHGSVVARPLVCRENAKVWEELLGFSGCRFLTDGASWNTFASIWRSRHPSHPLHRRATSTQIQFRWTFNTDAASKTLACGWTKSSSSTTAARSEAYGVQVQGLGTTELYPVHGAALICESSMMATSQPTSFPAGGSASGVGHAPRSWTVSSCLWIQLPGHRWTSLSASDATMVGLVPMTFNATNRSPRRTRDWASRFHGLGRPFPVLGT